MMSMLLRFVIFLVINLGLTQITHSKYSINSNDESDYANEEFYKTTANRTVNENKLISSSEYYDDEEASTSDDQNDEYSDYEEPINYEPTTDENFKQPYNCPSQCKCHYKKTKIFNQDYFQEDAYDYDNESVKLKKIRKRNQVGHININKTMSSYALENDYDDEVKLKSSKSRVSSGKYEISVDCNGQDLLSISDLFDYDFPVDRIVSL